MQHKLRWVRTYEAALKAYDDPEVAQAMAKRAAERGAYTRNAKKAMRLPDPGSTVKLGKMLELHTLTPAGSIEIYKFRDREAPDLLWSPSHREDQAKGSLYAFPGLKLAKPTENLADAQECAQLYEAWHAGTAIPRGGSVVTLPDPMMHPSETAAAIVYRSDKFSPGEKIDYIHHFEKNVRARVSSGDPPKAFYVAGGRLLLTERGLEH